MGIGKPGNEENRGNKSEAEQLFHIVSRCRDIEHTVRKRDALRTKENQLSRTERDSQLCSKTRPEDRENLCSLAGSSDRTDGRAGLRESNGSAGSGQSEDRSRDLL